MKQTLRTYWIQIRSQIKPYRRHQAELNLFEGLKTLTKDSRAVLSFFSFRNEISMDRLNDYLADNNQLCLPKVHEEQLQLYRVRSPRAQCKLNVWGILEPDPAQCETIANSEISTVLVPGLAFDSQLHRLGYGKGYYDRLLSQLNRSTNIFGVGFKEQFSENLLPVEAHDRALHRLLLF